MKNIYFVCYKSFPPGLRRHHRAHQQLPRQQTRRLQEASRPKSSSKGTYLLGILVGYIASTPFEAVEGKGLCVVEGLKLLGDVLHVGLALSWNLASNSICFIWLTGIFLNIVIDLVCMHSLGSAFQASTTLKLKNYLQRTCLLIRNW